MEFLQTLPTHSYLHDKINTYNKNLRARGPILLELFPFVILNQLAVLFPTRGERRLIGFGAIRHV